jgi:UDP-4-amino-4,6-dideoxy-N-acetyl-beta-L-altrosamine N-acetyltransferase
MKCGYNNLVLEVLTREDLPELRRIRNLVSENLTHPNLINEMEQEEWFKNMSLDRTRQYFAILQDRNLVGCIWYDDLDLQNGSCRIGLFIEPDHQAEGIGTLVSQTFTEYLFNTFRLHRISCLILEKNKPSRHVYEKLGYVKEGIAKDAIFRNGVYNNYVMYAKLCEKE